MRALDAYTTYLALKRHFASGSYDYFKYNGKVRVNKTNFQARKDRFHFERLAKKFKTRDELVEFFVSSLVTKPDIYIRDMTGSRADERYQNWRKHQQNLMYDFTQDIERIADKKDMTFNELFVCAEGQHPPLLQYYIGGTICIETLLAFDHALGCFNRWNTEIADPIVWPDLFEFAMAYKPFITLEREMIAEILRKAFVVREFFKR